MSKQKIFIFTFTLMLTFLTVSCSQEQVNPVAVKQYPVNSLEGIIAKSGVEFDKDITSDGNGSIRITATMPGTFRLFETGDIDVENAQLFYQAKLRTRDMEGQVFIEMWCRFPGKGEFFSRALQSPLSGSNDWTSQETPFLLKKGENPDNVKLNVVVNGRGTVWIDEIRLVKSSLP